jgi:hypothetical protein
MEISDLMPPFGAKPRSHYPETIEKDDQAWKYGLFSTKAGKFLIRRQAIQLDTIVQMPHLGNSDRKAKPLQVD